MVVLRIRSKVPKPGNLITLGLDEKWQLGPAACVCRGLKKTKLEKQTKNNAPGSNCWQIRSAFPGFRCKEPALCLDLWQRGVRPHASKVAICLDSLYIFELLQMRT